MITTLSAFQTYVLRTGDSTTPAFEPHSTDIKPGGQFSADADVILSGGFPQLFKETDIPLSPTLQVNGDLTTLSDEQLHTVAIAELERIHNLSFSSRIIEADPSVCVISNDPKKLKQFLDTYGGILEIEPRLLNKYHPDFITATEINIDQTQSGIIVNYTVRSPIDIDKCSYCGACGPVCPENCLSEKLFLDFSRCTFCTECGKICPHNIIDLHSVEDRSLRVPALIILEGTNIALPENNQAIYTEKTLDKYFKTVFAYQVDEVVTCDKTICQYSGRLDAGCNLCFENCPHGAIQQDTDGITVNALQCQECGNCISVCPTGSLQYQRFTDQAFLEYFRTFHLPQSSTVVIGDEQALHKLWWHNRDNHFENLFFIEFPEISALSLMHMLFLFAHGASHVTLLHSKNSKPGTSVLHQLSMANTIINTLFETSDRFTLCDNETFASAVKTFDHPLDQLFMRLNLVHRRLYLASILEFLVTQSGKETSFDGDEFTGFGTISCDTTKCTHCLACLNDCNINALSANEQEMTISYLQSTCVGCGTCVQVCPENALLISKDFVLNHTFFEPKVIAQAEPIRCTECGKIFGTRKSFEKVMMLLSSKNIQNDIEGLYECCDECRVIKMYESAETTHHEQRIK